MHSATINADAQIKENCIINTQSIVEHDSIVESHCHISTSAVINGGVTVAEGTFFGSNAVSKQGVATQPADFIKAGRCFTGKQSNFPNIAFLTTIFPIEESYVHDFMRSLMAQTGPRFDLIILNDGFDGLDRIKKQYEQLNIIELPTARNIAKNREVLLQYAIANGYEFAIFGDIDDYFAPDRVATSLKLLERADIVVNDLTSFNRCNILNEKFLSKRVDDMQHIALEFVLDKNLFGMSNTAIRLSGLRCSDICFAPELVAVDWYLFSSLLLAGRSAVFTNQTVTYYRQHDTNTVGCGTISKASIRQALAVKSQHYTQMAAKHPLYIPYLERVTCLSDEIQDDDILTALAIKNEQNIDDPLWWEITE